LPSRGKIGGTSGYCMDPEEYAAVPCDPTLAHQVRQFLIEETASRFRRYTGISRFIDETYEHVMQPFLAQIP